MKYRRSHYVPPYRININGKDYPLALDPLESFWNEYNPEPKLDPFYEYPNDEIISYWAVIDDWLYLTKINGKLLTGEMLNLQTYFPESSDKVFADWYTGTLKVHIGTLRYPRICEKNLRLSIKNGKVKSKQLNSIWRIQLGDFYEF